MVGICEHTLKHLDELDAEAVQPAGHAVEAIHPVGLAACQYTECQNDVTCSYLTCHRGAGIISKKSTVESAGSGAGLAPAGGSAVMTCESAAEKPALLLRPFLPTG